MKALLSEQGISYVEKDVSEDRQAAFEMVRRSRQQGVPVTVIDDEVVVGFDKPRLEAILAARARDSDNKPLRLGIKIATARPSRDSRQGESGAYIGGVEAGSIGASLGLARGDVIVALNGQPVVAAADVERIASSIARGSNVTIEFVRAGRTLKGEARA